MIVHQLIDNISSIVKVCYLKKLYFESKVPTYYIRTTLQYIMYHTSIGTSSLSSIIMHIICLNAVPSI